MPILGVIASSTRQGQNVDTGAMFPLQVISVGANGPTSITFSNIPNTYAHLQLRMFNFTNTANGSIRMRFNGDTGTNYAFHNLYGGGGGSVSTYNESSVTSTEASWAGWGQTNGGFISILDLPDYANTNKNKTFMWIGGNDFNATGNSYTVATSGAWFSTAAITSITLSNVTFGQHSQFALYGVKSA